MAIPQWVTRGVVDRGRMCELGGHRGVCSAGGGLDCTGLLQPEEADPWLNAETATF